MSSNWVAITAYLIDLVGTFVGQVAYILMKKGMIEVENSGLNGSKKKIPFFTCTWLIGFGCLIVASIVHVSALPFCDLVLLSTTTSVGILMNNILSVIYLDERLVWSYDIIAISLIIGGSLTIVLLSDYSETTFTPDDIRDLIFSEHTLVFVIVLLVFIVFTIAQFIWHRKQLAKFNALANVWLIGKLDLMQEP